MSSSIFFGGSLLAAIIAGAIALFAPCCISVMLPAYFASSFQKRRRLVAMTSTPANGAASRPRAPRPRVGRGFRLSPAWVVLGVVALLAIVVVGVLVYASNGGGG